MLKALFSLLKNPQLLLPLALFGAGVFMISMAWSSYQEQAGRELPDLSQKAAAKEPTSVQEIKSEFDPSVGMGEDFYDVIAQDNLFHRNREAWQPPEPKNDSQEKDTEQDRERQREDRRMSRVSHSKIRLYGTARSEQGKTALLFMDPFQADPKYRLAREGEVLRDEGDRGEWLYYQVMNIDQDKVTLEASDGESVQISLYGHQREQRQVAQAKEPSIQVVIGGEEQASASKQTSEPESGASATASEDETADTQAANKTAEKEEAESASPQGGQEQGSQGSAPGGPDGDQSGPEGAQGDKPQGLGDALRKMLEQRMGDSGNGNGKKIDNPFKSLIERNN